VHNACKSSYVEYAAFFEELIRDYIIENPDRGREYKRKITGNSIHL